MRVISGAKTVGLLSDKIFKVFEAKFETKDILQSLYFQIL